MRFPFLVLLVFTTVTCYPQEQETGRKIKLSGSFSLNSNGINPIPAFSLGKPAAMANLSITIGRFNYEPGLAYGLDAKPWYADNWMHFIIIDRPKFMLRAGVNFSMFYTEKSLIEGKYLTGERYLTGEIAGIFKLPGHTTLYLMYWNDNGQEHGSISGHYFNLIAEKNEISLGAKLRLSAYLQIFGLEYTAKNDGFFISPKLTLTRTDIPIALFTQVNLPVWTNMLPDPKFEWNVGIAYIF